MVYDRELRGTMGRFLGETDATNREIPGGEKLYLPSEDGYNLVLTIDEVLQHIAEREIDRLMEETKAKGAVVLISDPNTGEILALSNRPTFDLNKPLASPDSNRRNLAVWYNYEPGSTFKIVTAAAALEEKAVQESDGFYCRGSMQVAGHNIACVTAHGSQTFAEVVKNSCNVGFMTVGMRMSRETFYRYISDFGFGATPGSGLPGEEEGILVPVKSVGPVEQANISFGQGIAVTPLQMITMMGAVANGGLLMKPQIVREIRTVDGAVVQPFTPQMVRQVVSTDTAYELCRLLEAVVADGTGRGAQIPGYRLAGKTGTAQKTVDGRYVSDKHVASFVGFGPVDNPQLAILVVVDEPQGAYYGGVVAAPTFKRVMEDSLRYLSIPPTITSEEEKMCIRDRPKTARRRRRRVTRRVESLTAYGLFVAVAVGLVLLYVAQYAYVAQLNLRLNRAEKQLAQIQIQNEQLEQQASELRSLRRVEEEAKTRLGMQKPETVRTVRAPLEPVVDTAVAAAEPASPPLEGDVYKRQIHDFPS